MISLNLPTQPYDLPLPHGVVVTVRPLSAAVLATAQAHATATITRLREARQERAEVGLPLDDLPDLNAPDVREGQVIAALARGLARHAITGWRGIHEPWSPDMADQLMRHADMAHAFLRDYQAPVLRLDAEGNACAPALNGPSATGATIALDAAAPAMPAH